MNILFYGLNYAPEATGTGKYTGEMAAWFAARGHHVETICGLPHYPEWKLHASHADGKARVEMVDGVRVQRAPHHVPAAATLGAAARIRMETGFSLSAARYWLPRLFGRKRPDVVFAVMPPMQIGLWPLIFRWLRRVPWVLHVQDLQVDAAIRLGMLKVGVFGRVLYWIESFFLRQATRTSTITESMRDRIVAKGGARERAWLLPNWSDVRTIRPGPRENAFREELGLATTDILVIYAGNMGEKQGLEVVLEIASALREEPNIQFAMVGDGAARGRLERRAGEMSLPNLRFLPLQPLARLGEMLAAGDIHLVVQRRDAADLVMPSKLTNILAAGRASVATADPGTALHEAVAVAQTGLVVAPGDVPALTAAVRQLATDAPLRQACGLRARAYAEKHLDRDRVLLAFEQQLASLCP